MDLVIHPSGEIRCIYGEDIDLRRLERLTIIRGSYVEPTFDGQWTVDLSPMTGPVLGPYRFRSDALNVEHRWLLNFRIVEVARAADCQQTNVECSNQAHHS